MEHQSASAFTGEGDSIKETKITDKNAIVPDDTKSKKEAKEKELRQKINQYLESKHAITNAETKDEANRSNVVAEDQRKKNVPRKPCNHFNDFGTCKYESGHFSQAGHICLIHICRYCHDSSGKKEPHPATLCAQLKTKGVLRDLGDSLKIDNLNKDITEKGTLKEFGEDIAAKLYEPKVDMIVGVVEVIGRKAALKNFIKTQEVESAGGMMVFNGARRRTAGGTFLQLLRENPNIDQEKIATFLNRFNGVHVAMVKRKEEMVTSLGPSSSFHQSSSPESFVSKSFSFNNDQPHLKLYSGERGDASHEKLIGTKQPIVMAKPSSNESMNGIISRRGYIPRAGPVISRPVEIDEKSTARSRLVQSHRDYGKSTPKSRLSESMENYMGNVGTTRALIGNRSGYRTSQMDNSLRKDRKQDSRKSSIDQIIGCLNQQKNEPFKTNVGQVNAKSPSNSSNSQVNPSRKSNVYAETKNQIPMAEGETQVPMTTCFRNEPWLAAYNVAKQKAVHNLENGNLQSVSGISGYCGQVTDPSHLATSSSQIHKFMFKMKMEGRKETGNEYKDLNRKDYHLESKFELNPQAAPFNPSAVLFNPSTLPPSVNLPFSSSNESRKIKEGKIALSHSKNKAQISTLKGSKSLPRLSAELKSDFCKDENKSKSAAVKERRKIHCPCPPYCPPCLENMKAKV